MTIALLMGPTAAMAQTGTVAGRVTDVATAQGIPGAQVVVVGTKRGAVAGGDGRYVITDVPPGQYTVEAQVIGFATQSRPVTVRAGASVVVSFALRAQAVALNQLVVTGTAGAARRREVGNSIASVNAEQLEAIKPSTDVSDLLQAQVAGLEQFTTGGQVGAGKQIRLRGNNSITQGNSPLIIVDGVRLTNAVPDDEGSQQVTTALDLLNPDDIDHIEVIRGAAATTLYGTEASSGVIQIFTKKGQEGKPSWTFTLTQGANFVTSNGLGPVVGQDPNWLTLKPWLRTGGLSSIDGSVRGGGKEISYYLSGAYDNQAGVFPTQGSKTTSFRTNATFTALPNLTLTVNSQYFHRFTNWIQSGDNADGVVLNLLRSPKNYTSGDNGALFQQRTTSIDDHFVGGITILATPFQGVTNRFTAGLDWRDGTNDWTIPRDNVLLPTGARDLNRWRHTTLTLDYVGSWDHDVLKQLNSKFSWGFQVFNDYDQREYGTSQDFAGPGINQTLSSGSLRNSSETLLKVINAGFFFQELAGLSDKLFLTAGLRVDGNSAFGQDFGLQPYPKLSASYILSDNSFWPKWWETMKLRAAIGQAGKAPGVFDATRTYLPVSANGGQPGVTPDNLGNPKLGPERTTETELGFETSAFNELLALDFSWYLDNTMDALVPIQYPPSQGFANPQLSNVGQIQNKGVEVSLTVNPVRQSNVNWNARVQLSTNYSKAINLHGSRLQIGFQSWRQWAIAGYPVPGYWDIKVTNPNAIADPILSDTAQFYGPVYPTHTWSFSTTLTLFQRFTLYALGEQSGGQYLLNAVARQQAVRGLWPECTAQLKNPGQMTALWRARCIDQSWSAWIMPADYFKLRTISLSYHLPSGLVPGATSALLTLAANNLWKSTKYSGLDPEITRGDTFLEKREYYGVPPTQQVTASLRITF